MLTLKRVITFSFLILFVFICWNILSKNSIKISSNVKETFDVTSHVVIDSVFYYEKSKLYLINSMVILINGRKDLEIKNLQCFSKNAEKNLTTTSQIRPAEPGPHCLWIMYIINCTTVDHPEYFGFKLENSSAIIEINFEYPIKEKFPVVMCYPPMVYESRWHQIIFATEIYHYFGTNLQVQYINSAMTEIVDILKIYQAKRWISIEKFAYIDFSPADISKIGYQPMSEISDRNQPLAYTKCLMKYREAAEFIIVADVDDILIPKYTNYYQEFRKWNAMFPGAAAFMYFRTEGSIFASTDFKNFSIYNTIRSIKVARKTVIGKSVYQTKNAEVAWIHWPFFENQTTKVIPSSENKMFHLGTVDNLTKTFNVIPKKALNKIASEFATTFQNVSSFKENKSYAQAIFKCYGKHALWNAAENFNKRRPCLTPLYCSKPNYVKGFKCQVAHRKFIPNYLHKRITLHVPYSNYFWTYYQNGCTLFQR